MASCPFNDPNFIIPCYEPCPVCGVLSFPYADAKEIDERCVEGLLGDKERLEKVIDSNWIEHNA